MFKIHSKTTLLLKRVDQKHCQKLDSMGLAKKEQNIGPQEGSKHKIASYEAKWDFEVLKMPSRVVKLVFYLFNKLARSIFLTGNSRDHTKSKNKQNKTSIQWTPGSRIYLSSEKISFSQK